MKRYRRLEVGETIKQGDEFNAVVNEQPPKSRAGMVFCSNYEHGLCTIGNKITNELLSELYVYRLESFIPKRLIRKYRIVKDSEPVQMFDWFMTHRSYCSQTKLEWPEPNVEFNNGWTQILPDRNYHLLDGHPENRRELIFARFVDCIPRTKS